MPSRDSERRSRQSKTNLDTILRGHIGQRTVLGIAIPVLSEHIDALRRNREPTGLSEKQIEREFKELNTQYLNSEYHSTYLHRGIARFLEQSKGRYRFRKQSVSALSLSDLEQLRHELVESLRSAYEKRQAVIQKLTDACALPTGQIEERYSLVNSYLSQISGDRGEMFEVVSFAILREYFRTFGFSLQRFSTTHANDGGMDFVGGEAIYQVTTDESLQKVRRDLAKAPGTKRVLIRPSLNEATSDLFGVDVLETIELKDLLSHFISWLLARDTRSKQARHLQQVLEIALQEFRRENRAEAAVN